MSPSNKPTNKDFSLSSPAVSPTTSVGLGTDASKTTPKTNDFGSQVGSPAGSQVGSQVGSQMGSQVGEARSATSSDIRELGNKFSADQPKQETKAPGKELATGAQGVVVDKAIEVKDAVVDKAVEVKDVIVETTAEAADAALEKLGEAKQVVTEALDDAGSVAARWGRASWRFTTANAFPLALFGLGASWMIMNNRRATTPLVRRSQPQPTELYLGAPDRDVDLWDPLDTAVERGEYAGNGRKRVSNVKERTLESDGESLARGNTDPLVQRGKRQAAKGARIARESLSKARDASLDFIDANPLVVALGTLAAGVGVGLLLPTTELEERILAPTRDKFDRLIGDAREVATDVVEMAKETANETMAHS